MKRWTIKKAGLHKLISDREFPWDIVKIKSMILEKIKRYGMINDSGYYYVSFDEWSADLEMEK